MSSFWERALRVRRGLILLCIGVATLASTVGAQNKPLLIELPPRVIPQDVDAHGFTVVGFILGGGTDPRFNSQGFYWTPTSGVVAIGGTAGVSSQFN